MGLMARKDKLYQQKERCPLRYGFLLGLVLFLLRLLPSAKYPENPNFFYWEGLLSPANRDAKLGGEVRHC